MTDVQPRPKGAQRVAKDKKKQPSPRVDRDAATTLHSLIVRSRGYCEAAWYLPQIACEGQHEAAHIIGRASAGTRTRVDNAMCLCHRHHYHLDTHLQEKIEFVERQYGEGTYRRLQAMADAHTANPPPARIFWREQRAGLRDQAIDMGLRIR